MDQMSEGSTAILMPEDSSSSAGIYYSIPIEDADDEYAQFAAEHAHIDDGAVEDVLMAERAAQKEDNRGQNEVDIGEGEHTNRFKMITTSQETSATTSRTTTTSTTRRGAIVKAEPLEIYSDAMGANQAVEMLTMWG